MAYDYTYEEERPQLKVLRYINPAAFAPHHLKQLYRLERFAWDGSTAIENARRIAGQDVWLWEVGDDEEHAIVLTSICAAGDNLILFVEGMAGDGILARSEDLVNDVHTIARFYGCSRVRATSERDGFVSFAEQHGFLPKATVWEAEVRNGQQGTSDTDADAEG